MIEVRHASAKDRSWNRHGLGTAKSEELLSYTEREVEDRLKNDA
jgi:hypothetical protein